MWSMGRDAMLENNKAINEPFTYSKELRKYENIYNWAKERYDIEIEGYAVVRVAVTYDNGEPVTQNMDVIKYEDNWYARDLLGI